ncbi:MAG: ribonuclease III [Planctomycetes bacterium]|nr:ribonuclease III [Planctomycetota bacterium]
MIGTDDDVRGDGSVNPGGLDGCEDLLGYRFTDQEILVRALTHSSSKTAFSGSNERLEFLGDAILGSVVSLYLYAHHPDFQEGRMTKVKSQVVSRRSLALKAREIGLAPYLVVGRMFPTPNAITNSILSNALEAVIAAVFIDGGLDAAFDFVMRHFQDVIATAADEPGHRDFKSWLGQWAQQNHMENPGYIVLSTAGPDHTKTFEMSVSLSRRRFPAAWGRSKKEAEQRAARASLRELGLL